MAHAGLVQIDAEQLPHDVNNNGSLAALWLQLESPAAGFLWQIEHDSVLSPAIDSFGFFSDTFLGENEKKKIEMFFDD